MKIVTGHEFNQRSYISVKDLFKECKVKRKFTHNDDEKRIIELKKQREEEPTQAKSKI